MAIALPGLSSVFVPAIQCPADALFPPSPPEAASLPLSLTEILFRHNIRNLRALQSVQSVADGAVNAASTSKRRKSLPETPIHRL